MGFMTSVSQFLQQQKGSSNNTDLKGCEIGIKNDIKCLETSCSFSNPRNKEYNEGQGRRTNTRHKIIWELGQLARNAGRRKTNRQVKLLI